MCGLRIRPQIASSRFKMSPTFLFFKKDFMVILAFHARGHLCFSTKQCVMASYGGNGQPRRQIRVSLYLQTLWPPLIRFSGAHDTQQIGWVFWTLPGSPTYLAFLAIAKSPGPGPLLGQERWESRGFMFGSQTLKGYLGMDRVRRNRTARELTLGLCHQV